MSQESDAQFLHTISTPGWALIKGIALQMIKDDENYLLDAMGRNPSSLIESEAIKHASRRAAFIDFLDEIDSKARLIQSK